MNTKIGLIFWVGSLRISSVGPKFDPYHRECRYVVLKDGRSIDYVNCSLSGPHAQTEFAGELGEPELLALGLPTFDEVERFAARREEKNFRKEVSAYRAAGYRKAKARRLALEDIDCWERAEAEMRSMI